MSAHAELTRALKRIVDNIDQSIRDGGYQGEAIRMIIAGGIAVHRYCGTRYTQDIDATFSRMGFNMPTDDGLQVQYRRDDNKLSLLYLDKNYNSAFALMHEDHEEDALEWEGIGNEERIIRVYTLAPVDLALSKIARYGEQDREDILALAAGGWFTAEQFRTRALEALPYFVGNMESARTGIDLMFDAMLQQRQASLQQAEQMI